MVNVGQPLIWNVEDKLCTYIKEIVNGQKIKLIQAVYNRERSLMTSLIRVGRGVQDSPKKRDIIE